MVNYCSGEYRFECSQWYKNLAISFIDDRIVRLCYMPQGYKQEQKSYIVQEVEREKPFISVIEDERSICLSSKVIRVSFIKATERVLFQDSRGKELMLEEQSDRTLFDGKVLTENTLHSVQSVFSVDKDIQYYGLGQHQNTSIAIPFLITNKNFGILWDNNGRTFVDMSGESELKWESDTGELIDYYFIYGETVDEIVQSYWRLTGPSPMIPKWAFGFWQSKMRYMNRQELLEVAEKYRERKYPADIIVIDYYHWTQMGDFTFDPEAWPEPEEMFRKLSDLNFKTMISVWPSIVEKSKNFSSMGEKGYLLCGADGRTLHFTIFNGEVSGLYDPFNREARDYVWEKAKKYYEQGARIWWLDSCEPDDGVNMDDFWESGIYTKDGPLYERLNAYPLLHFKTFYEGQKAMDPDRRVLIFARAAFAGCQRYGVTVWSGDVGYDFKALKSQIAAGLNATMSGLPFWTTDIGGFTGGNPEDPTYQEVYIRWFQYGAFCPLFRVHGSRGATCHEDLLYGISRGGNELWSFGTELEKIMVKYDRLRYRLMPYIYSCARETMLTGTPLMRALVVDFTEDRKAERIADQYMFGKSMMVCPVTQAGVDAREVYLPAGSDWYDFWSGSLYAGNQTLAVPVSLDRIPVFVKAGSMIPIGPVEQYIGEISKNKITLLVYPGNDCEFELYNDDGDTHAYERGEFCLIKIKWDDKNKYLSMEDSNHNMNLFFEEQIEHIIAEGLKGESII